MSTCLPLGDRRIGRIPVRNLWLLMLYASDLTRASEVRNVLMDDEIDDLPDLIARLLADSVDLRLRRNLTRGYRHRESAVTRVRGHVDFLTTAARLLLEKGEVFCRFEELTIDTPRNRLVRSALDRVIRLVQNADLVRRCRSLASSLARMGVGGACPTRADLARDQIGRNDSADRYMIALSQLAFDLALPTGFWLHGTRNAGSGRGVGASLVRKGCPGVRARRVGTARMVRPRQHSPRLAGVIRLGGASRHPSAHGNRHCARRTARRRTCCGRHEVFVDSCNWEIRRCRTQERIPLPDVRVHSITGGPGPPLGWSPRTVSPPCCWRDVA